MRLWSRRIGTALGMLAVALSLYLPIHIASDIVEAAMDALAAAENATICHAATSLADADVDGSAHSHHGGPHHHHDTTCPICGSVSTAAAATLLPTSASLAAPKSIAVSIPAEAAAQLHAVALHAPYSARAPPRSA